MAGDCSAGAAAQEAQLRRAAAIAVVLAVTAARADPDPWFGADKAAHFGFSAALAIGGYGISSTFLQEPKARLGYGAAVALLAGIGKELWDVRPSLKDLTWDVLGTAVGLAICWAIDELFFRPAARPAAAGLQLR